MPFINRTGEMDASLQVSRARLAFFAKVDRLAFAIESSKSWPLVIFLVTYLPLTVLIASHKLMWDDEFFTLYLSRPGSLSGILKALETGADQHPPPFYLLIHQITAALGPSHLTLRLAAVFGYGLFCICLFFLLRNRTSVLWAMVGMLLPLVTNAAYYYASEARGYSLMLGFCSLALLSWQKATAVNRRSGWLCLLAGALIMAVSSHYYAILFVIPLGIGELTRTYLLKRVDIYIWLSFCAAAVPPIAFLSTIRHASQYSTHFWAIPYWSSVLQFYPTFLGTSATIFLLGALLYLFHGLWGVPCSVDNSEGHVPASGFVAWEILTWLSIAAIPIFAIILAKFVTHGYVERYALPGLIGAVLIICYTGFHVARQSRIIPFFLSLICVLFICLQGVFTLRAQPRLWSGVVDNMVSLAPHTAQPVVVSDVTLFHRVSFYAPRQLARSMIYLSDPADSWKYLRQDTIDRGLLDLRPWFPLHIVERARYVEEHSRFLVFGSVGPWNWLTYVFTPPGYKTEILERSGEALLLRVQKAVPTPESPRPDLHRADSEYLFNHVRATGPSLCEEWFSGDDVCVTIEQELQERLQRP
jgi:hypothetical protein